VNRIQKQIVISTILKLYSSKLLMSKLESEKTVCFISRIESGGVIKIPEEISKNLNLESSDSIEVEITVLQEDKLKNKKIKYKLIRQ